MTHQIFNFILFLLSPVKVSLSKSLVRSCIKIYNLWPKKPLGNFDSLHHRKPPLSSIQFNFILRLLSLKREAPRLLQQVQVFLAFHATEQLHAFFILILFLNHFQISSLFYFVFDFLFELHILLRNFRYL